MLALAQEELASKPKGAESLNNKTELQTVITSKNLKRSRTAINLISPENKDEGQIGWKDYKEFAAFSYGCCGLVLGIIVCTLTSIA